MSKLVVNIVNMTRGKLVKVVRGQAIIRLIKEKENSTNQERTKTMKVRFMLNKEARKAQAINELVVCMKLAQNGYNKNDQILRISQFGDILRRYGIMSYTEYIEMFKHITTHHYRKYDTFINDLVEAYDYACWKVNKI